MQSEILLSQSEIRLLELLAASPEGVTDKIDLINALYKSDKADPLKFPLELGNLLNNMDSEGLLIQKPLGHTVSLTAKGRAVLRRPQNATAYYQKQLDELRNQVEVADQALQTEKELLACAQSQADAARQQAAAALSLAESSLRRAEIAEKQAASAQKDSVFAKCVSIISLSVTVIELLYSFLAG